MRRVRDARGATLAELLVFVVASVIVLEAGISLSARALKDQARAHGEDRVLGAAQLAAAHLERVVSQASAIVAPLPGRTGDRLEGYIGRARADAAGLDWLNARTGDVSGSYDRFLFCVDSEGRLLFHLEKDVALIAAEPGTLDCGAAGAEVLAGGKLRVQGRIQGRAFRRPPGLAHLVETELAIRDAKGGDAFELKALFAAQAGAEEL